MDKKQIKLKIIFSICIIFFMLAIVPIEFQNDTYFNISIGKYILENGIDMQDHFSWVPDNLEYGYSHWLFDIVTYLIYNTFGFTGIYFAVIIFSSVISVTLFILLSKRTKSPIVSFVVTLISTYIINDAFTARSQIISFLCFIVEIYCLEEFIETRKKRYGFILFIQAVIVANVHAATWPLLLVLFLPYLAPAILKIFSSKSIFKICIKRLENKIAKLPKDSEKIAIYEKDIADYKRLCSKSKNEYSEYKIISREDYYFKGLIILFIIIALSGLLTPIKGTPYTYIINSMFGESNFENQKSMDYISEMQPLAPLSHLGIIVFSILFITFLAFLPSKLKMEHGFLVLGLLIMALASKRYMYLLVLLGSYALADLMTCVLNFFILDDIKLLENIFTKKWGIFLLFLAIIPYSLSTFLHKQDVSYVNKSLYPVEAVIYIKENLDYRNIRIFNAYDIGSYLMLNDIPVFIDSRLDVYCSEFNDTDIFYDFIQIYYGYKHYGEVLEKYDVTHVLLTKNDVINQFISKDLDYKLLHEDGSFVLYEKIN